MTVQPTPLSRILKRAEAPSATLLIQSINSPLGNVTACTVNFALALVPARALGVEGLGACSIAMDWALILGAAAGLDLNRLVVLEMTRSLLAAGGVSFKHAGVNKAMFAPLSS